MTNEPTDEALENLFVEETGFDIDDFPAAIFGFARAVLAKRGQPAQAAEPVYAFRRKGFDDFCTCTEKRYAELSAKPNLFETRIFYTAPQPVAREPLDKRLRVKLGSQYGEHLAGHWFYLTPADECAEAVLSKHHGIKGGQHGTE